MTPSRKQLESMLEWTAKIQPGRTFLKTSMTPAELKNAGCNELNNRWFYGIMHDGKCINFEVMPKKP